MRILVLSDKVMDISLGDGLRLNGLLRPLAGRHRFDLLCFAGPNESVPAGLRDLFADVTLLPMPTADRSGVGARFCNLLKSDRFKPSSAAMRAAISTALTEGSYDAVLDFAANASINLPPAPLPVPLIVDSIDEPLLRQLRALRTAPLNERPAHLLSAWRFWLYERQVLGRATLNVYASEVDAAAYARFFPDRAASVVPNGVDTEFFHPMDVAIEPRTVVFEGNMNFEPNIDAAQRLVTEVLPLMRYWASDVHVLLVGRDPAPEVRALASSYVTVTGTVDDVRPYLARAAVFACPMRLGSGIKNKILQAWAMGRPVVATRESLGGLSAEDGINLLVRDNMQDFAHAVAELLLDRARGATIGAAGRQTAEREYSWHHRAAQFERLVVKTIEDFRRRSTVVSAAGHAQ